MFLTDRWEDITGYTRQQDTITITRGRKDENTKTPPSTARLTLDNTSGDFSMRNPLGRWYGELGRNNPIEIAKRVVTDAFSRTVSGGFGTTDTKQRWTFLSGPTTASVASGGAAVTVSAGQTLNMQLPDVVCANASVRAEFSLPVTNITGDMLMPGGVFVRGTSSANFIYARIEVNTDETITLGIRNASGTTYVAQVATGITNVAGQRLSVRLLADGGTLAAKLWITANGEPLAWQAVAVERAKGRGVVGLRTASGAASTNSPVTVTYYSFAVESVRFTGEVSNFPAASDSTARNQYVPIEAAGVLRRLGQGDAPTLSAIKRGTLAASNLVAYWPCEEDDSATTIGAATASTLNASFYPAGKMPDFATNSDFLCSAPLPKLNGATVVCAIPTYDTSAGKVQARILFSVPAGGIPADESVIRLFTQGDSALWDVVLQADGNLRVDAYNSSGIQILVGGAIGFALNGKQIRMSLELTQNGSNVDYNISTLTQQGAAGGFSGTVTSTNFTRVDSIYIGSKQTAPELVFGHISFQNNVTDIFELADQLAAHVGERALTRMIRLSQENGISFVYNGVASDTTQLGAQLIKTYVDLIYEAGASDVGTVHEKRGFAAVAYRTRIDTYGQSSTVTLDLAKFQVGTPFQPVDDDRASRNDITAKRIGGGEVRAILSSGPLSVLTPPDGIGRYTDAPQLSLQSDAQLGDLANWLLALGTVNEARYPNLKVDLDAPAIITAALAPSVLDLDIDDRMSVINAAVVRIYDPINLLVRGYTETLGNHRHFFSLNLSPSAPYDIGVLDDGLFRLDSGTSSLTNQLTKGITGAVSVTTTNPGDLWTTAGGDFPQDMMIGGERVTISGISGASSPQTFTISARAVNGVAKTHAAGTAVHSATPWRIGM